MSEIYLCVVSGFVGGVIVLGFWELMGPYVNSKREMKISKLTSHWGKFDEIECRELKVVERDGTARVILTTDWVKVHEPRETDKPRVFICGSAFGSEIILRGADTDAWGSAKLIATSDGGRMYLKSIENLGIVQVCYKDEGAMVSLGIDEYGGRVEAHSKEFGGRPGMALNVDKNGGCITTEGVVVIDRFGNVKTKNT